MSFSKTAEQLVLAQAGECRKKRKVFLVLVLVSSWAGVGWKTVDGDRRDHDHATILDGHLRPLSGGIGIGHDSIVRFMSRNWPGAACRLII
jgi:hypothetical protein